MPTIPEEVDVLIVGGGPIGLLLAYQILLFSDGNITIHIVEKNPKPQQEQFGRAVTFWSRSMEMLEQVGLGKKIAQQCFAVRTSVGYDGEGNEVKGRGWSFVEDIRDTKWSFATVCRQKYIEDIYRGELAKMGVKVHAPAEFRDMLVDEEVPAGDYCVTATIYDAADAKDYRIKCRYIIGADGSRTAVRRAAGIDSDGDSTEDRWVRIDGMLTTDMPKFRSYGAIESKTYGNVLWIPLDRGVTRIGYHLTEERWKYYGGVFNEDLAISEAKEAVKPFKIDYSRVDWASIYHVGQRIARSFFAQGCVFLAGDSCHTHSSGAGQGMNAGTHDAINLAWKLSLVLRGIAKPSLLDTYEHERRPNAQKLIDYDKDISVLISKRLPKNWTGDPDADPNVVLGQILSEAKGFNTGLTIGYERNMLNLATSGMKVYEPLTSVHAVPAPASPGYRGPDVQLVTPATFELVRMYSVTPNRARFRVILFTGDPVQTSSVLTRFCKALTASKYLRANDQPSTGRPTLANGHVENESHADGDCNAVASGNSPSSRLQKELPIDFLTILATQNASVWEAMGNQPAIGDAYFDPDHSAHERYGIHGAEGAVVVLRPDGWIGARLDLKEVGSAEELVRVLEEYFKTIFV